MNILRSTVLPLLCLSHVLLSGCHWLRKEAIVISSHGTNYGERYFSARLIEKLKTVDGPSIKDASLIKAFKEALTEELIVEGALFSWARAHHITFTNEDLQKQLTAQMGEGANTQDRVLEAEPSLNLLRDALYIQLIQQKLQEHLLAENPASEEDLKQYFNTNRTFFEKPKIQFRQIVVANEHEAQILLQNIRENKISFNDAEKKFSLIREYKEDADIPLYEVSGTGILTQLLHSPVGLQQRVFTSPSGFHIVKVLQIKKNTTQSYDALRPQVTTLYNQKKANDLYLQWLRDHVNTKSVIVDQARLLALKAEYQESF